MGAPSLHLHDQDQSKVNQDGKKIAQPSTESLDEAAGNEGEEASAEETLDRDSFEASFGIEKLLELASKLVCQICSKSSEACTFCSAFYLRILTPWIEHKATRSTKSSNRSPQNTIFDYVFRLLSRV